MTKILITEVKLYLRDWPFALFTIVLPVGLLVILGVSIPSFTEANPAFGGQRFVDTQMPSMMTLLALLTIACSVLPAVLATYREQGVLRRMSTTPMHPGKMLTAQLIINVVSGAISTAVLIGTASLVFGSQAPQNWGWFIGVFLLGTAALLSIGLVIAALAPHGKAASGIGSAVMFPLLFLGGMWVPREIMPDALRTISDYSLVGPFAQALKDAWSGQPPQLSHLMVVTVGLLLFGGLSVRLFRWE
ncbi:ABC transporter permease [Nonomuraea rhizosphaerae]|uniref:ABC transporter permease n=1 Tax=Nonomuraea rhizosphaerae TaxID=2665663 RepID=UPI001C5D90A9|nr:ABC transporter permease [Nonomuraea rhizosphaerae]